MPSISFGATKDLRFDGLHERKRKLRALIQSKGWLLYCDHIEQHGESLYEIVSKNDLEGIVAKPRNSPYQFTETHTYWLKLKNPYYTQAMGRDDLLAPPGRKARSRIGQDARSRVWKPTFRDLCRESKKSGERYSSEHS